MATILRSPQYNYNPQIHTEDNSLTHLMAKDFEVRRQMFQLHGRYAKITSFANAAGMMNGGLQNGKMKKDRSNELYDNAYRISYEGALFTPSYFFGSARVGEWYDTANPTPNMTTNVGVTYATPLTSSTVATNTLISVAVKHDPSNGIDGSKIQPHESIPLGSDLGIEIIVARAGRLASTGDHYVYDGKTVGPATLFDEDHLAEDVVVGYGGSRYGEGSLYGNQKTSTNKWRINYSHKQRYTLSMTGDAARQKISYLYNSEKPEGKAWEYAEVLKAEERFAMGLEQGLRVSRMTMDPTGHKWFENFGTNNLSLSGFTAQGGITAPMSGDGWIPQIQDNAVFEYNPNTGLSHLLLEAIMNALAQRSHTGSDGNLFIFVTDRIGRMVVDKGIKKMLGWEQSSTTNQASSIVINIQNGQKNTVGFEFKAYEYLGNKVVVFEDELLNNPALYPTNGGITGSGNIYIINATSVDGVANFEVFNGYGRGYLKKYEDGLHSFDPANESSHAPSGYDGKKMHLFSEQMAILYNTKSCGILKATAAYNGGALSGTDWLNANSTALSFIF